LIAVASAASADAPRKPDTVPVPLLWKVSGQDNAVYLLGSFHLLKSDDYPLSADVERAFADSRVLMFELAPEDMDSPQVASMMMQAAMNAGGERLQDMLSNELWARLRNYAEGNHFPLSGFTRFKPWFVALTISITEMNKQGLDPELGLDSYFVRAARQHGKTAMGLELADEQVALLSGMTMEEQRQMLSEVLEQAENGGEEVRTLHAAWRRGDVAMLWDDMAVTMRREYPALYQRINVDRNDTWIPKIEQRLGGDEGNTLIVVGALHLLGDDGVVEKLRAKGYRVERICSACVNAKP
jgi:uncharacterized protein YbaP (TraB family)